MLRGVLVCCPACVFYGRYEPMGALVHFYDVSFLGAIYARVWLYFGGVPARCWDAWLRVGLLYRMSQHNTYIYINI